MEPGSLPSQNIRASAGNRTTSSTHRTSGAEGAVSRIICDSKMGNYSAKPVDPSMSHCTKAMLGSLSVEEGSARSSLKNSEICPNSSMSPQIAANMDEVGLHHRNATLHNEHLHLEHLQSFRSLSSCDDFLFDEHKAATLQPEHNSAHVSEDYNEHAQAHIYPHQGKLRCSSTSSSFLFDSCVLAGYTTTSSTRQPSALDLPHIHTCLCNKLHTLYRYLSKGLRTQDSIQGCPGSHCVAHVLFLHTSQQTQVW